ncbi:MAG: 50S ribosomal protein L25 [Candidatus Magasanikbacteria bacterium]|nr:50S ribosomal protein L25 [Candidatus Magasanikbacteria bacterium]|tara:strand:+ start:2425 stop:3081 length:657 start_codon:yes stop_codon:yes gene_type:complete
MTYTINAIKREGTAAEIRAQGNIPAVVYGGKIENTPLAVKFMDFEKTYQEAGDSSIIELVLDGKTMPVLVQDVQIHPVKRTPIHIDFKYITMGEEIAVDVELEFTGVAAAEKEQGGTLLKAVNGITVRCLPSKLISSLVVDISTLNTFEDVIKAGDLPLPEGVVLESEAEILIAKVVPPLTEEKIKAMEEKGAGGIDSVEVEEKGKKEEDKDGEEKGK